MKSPASYILIACLLGLMLSSSDAWARPEYASATAQKCETCHEDPQTGTLNKMGLGFQASGHKWPPPEGYRVIGGLKKPVRVVIGYIHILAGFFWFGTILYVHILLKPAYAARGLPKGEVLSGMASMAAVGVTGLMLTASRITHVSVLFGTYWGVLLLVKAVLYLFMICTAAFVVAFIGPKLREASRAPATIPPDGVFGPQNLSPFDGRDGRPAFLAYEGRVYDATGVALWKDGLHMKHRAGVDLTQELKRAPHGEEKLDKLKIVGTYDAGRSIPLTGPQRAFYTVAYINLGMVLLVLFVIALWRWGS